METSHDYPENQKLSPWWRRGLVIILLLEFATLIWVTTGSYYRKSQPPIPEQVTDSTGLVVFTKIDIEAGQQVFLKKGLMNNGSIWGHGAYMGPDYSAQYLHNLAMEVRNQIALEKFKRGYSNLTSDQKESLVGLTRDFLITNRYNPDSHTLYFTKVEINSFNAQISYWKEYFQKPSTNLGLPKTLIVNQVELRQLTSFFAWAAWASVANQPTK
ncbi:MAG TPA: hypothetical protein VFK73_10190, partial [Paludibacter sp.]|nr:hypothetical protein [Paludibacter sp.]